MTPNTAIDPVLLSLLEILTADTLLFAQIAGLALSEKEGRHKILAYVTEASPELQQGLNTLLETALAKRPKELVATLAEALPAQYIQVGTIQPVALGSPASVVMLGARIALDNDPTDGTLGALLEDYSRNRYLLTCRHVLDGQLGARVVLRNVNIDDQWVARLTAISNWTLGSVWTNTTDFALARILDTVITDPRTPIGTPPLGSSASAGPPPQTISPLLNLSKIFTVEPKLYCVLVEFPYGEIRLSNMWLAHAQDAKSAVADFGDSGSLFVSQDAYGNLVPAALAVAVTSEYTPLVEDRALVTNYGPALLLCPVQNVFDELAGSIPGLKFLQ
jgi:hypothetical protein